MTFIYELGPYSLEIYRLWEYELPIVKAFASDRHTHRQDIQIDTTEIIYHTASWVVNKLPYNSYNSSGDKDCSANTNMLTYLLPYNTQKIGIHHLTATLSASEFHFLLPQHPSTFHIPDPRSTASQYTAFSSIHVKKKQTENEVLRSTTHGTRS